MDDLSAAIANYSFSVSEEPNSIHAPHPRFAYHYKSKGDFADQRQRRNNILKQQKERRFDFLNHVRDLGKNRDPKGKGQSNEEDMETNVAFRKPGKGFDNQLMFSEWMIDIPDDFATDWLMMPCPIGKRTLVIASRGSTKSYSKGGYPMSTFPSLLPGGNKHISHEYTVLDCIYSEVDRTFWVQDMMCWKSHPIYDTETEFRFYWMHTKLPEDPRVAQISKINPYKFVPLPYCECDLRTIEDVMERQVLPNVKLDGLLFFHKKTHYNFGSTPLVVWLKAYMMPEVLGVKVPEEYMKQRPGTYIGHKNYMEKVEKDGYAKKATRRQSSGKGRQCTGTANAMETEASKPTQSTCSVNVESKKKKVPTATLR